MTTEDPADEPVETAEAPQGDPFTDVPQDRTASARPPGAPWSLVAVALSLAVLGLTAAAFLFFADPRSDDQDQGRTSALDAARERTQVLTSYAHTTLDADVKRVLDRATGEFESEYTKTITQLRPTFTSTQAVATSEVKAAGLESYEQDRAVAVVAVDQVITTAGAAPREERNRLRMTLVRPDGTWLVEKVERL